MTVRVEQVAASRTRLSWQTSLQLQGWQLRWQLTQAQTDQPLQSARFGGCEIYWRVRHNELSAMIWPVLNSRAAADLRMGEVELPFALVAPDLRAALGVIEDGQMLRLQPQTTMEELGPPQAFLLSAAFPNPLRRMQHGTVAWRYALPEAATVEFRIFNMLGQELRRVHLGEQPAGRGQWQWDGRDQAGRSLASGVYFVEFSAGRFKQRERVLLR